jgi:hypothetical protein
LALQRSRHDEDQPLRQPVAGIDHQVADGPLPVIEKKVVPFATLAVVRLDLVSL